MTPPAFDPIEIEIEPDIAEPQEIGVAVQADGGVVVDLHPPKPDNPDGEDDDFSANLAMEMGESELNLIAERLLEGIEADDQSRSEKLQQLKTGMDMLGLTVELPSQDATASQGSMSKVRHPVLLEAVLRAQATAAAELLPARGPVKVKNDGTGDQGDRRAEALERDFNHYLTTTASEYYPDTRRALFGSSFSGSAFKKVYNCPIRRRPVSETVDEKDVIVSNAATDLANAGRVTHKIDMRPSIMRRMQVAGVYRDVELTQPTSSGDVVDQKLEQISGVQANTYDRPEDQPYTVYETYCELDLEDYAPKQFKGKGIPLPYRVTLEKDTRVVLEITRNWDEDDEQCLPKEFLVKYPYIEAMGLYGLGLLHVLGNSDATMTAAWRLVLDSGMANNFPGGLIDNSVTKQLNNHIQVPIGALAPINTGNRDIRTIAMSMPGKPLDTAFVAFLQHVEETAKALGGTAEVPVGEGRQDAPVGTTLAMIEQATKISSEVHKGLYAAQAKEFQLLKARFREDPEAFWRHNKSCSMEWNAELFLSALNDCSIVPSADPNTPSHLHRIMKIGALKQVAAGNPRMNQDEIDKELLRMIGFDNVERYFLPPTPPSSMPDPNAIMAMAALIQAQSKSKDTDLKVIIQQMKDALERDRIKSEERVSAMKVAATVAIHPETEPLVQRTIASNAPKP